ncbi:S41 family peptidase [Halobacteriovorax sp. YZS-1-1]|uniref:S41 family peptidase n=1 Tax=unclassified Halobacteriovorax TaxID=2639665 RepID=UPI00399B6FD5
MKKIVLALALSALVTPTFAKEKDSQASRFEKLELFNKVIHIIETNYYRKVNIDKLIDGALKGMFQTLDPHSAFLDKEVFKKMQEDTSGEYGGLGIEVTQKDGVLVITTPIEDSPAEKAGLKPGDKIVEINNESTIGITLDEAVDRMKGDLGTVINLGILRAGERDIRYFDVKRQKIKTKPVKSYAVKDYVVIRLSQFQKDAARHVVRALKKHKKQLGKKFKGVVLDLRSNPGGLLNEAVNLSSIFLNDGVVVSTEGRDPKNKEIRYVKKSGHKELDCPLAVLIDGKSASASEIVAGALQDHKRAIVVGTNSFGKGSVQTVSQITEDAGIKLTIAQYMTPKGRKIQALGIKPDVMVSQVEGEFVEENMYDDGGIREVDLRNHLTATVETEEEKKARLKREKIARKKRIERAREINKHIKNKDKDRKYSASEDYQVIQAIKFLNTVNKFKKM